MSHRSRTMAAVRRSVAEFNTGPLFVATDDWPWTKWRKDLARDRGKHCRLCRREGMKLFLKGEKCYKPSCPIEKRGTQPPGQHGPNAKRKPIGYGEQLREKQRVKRIYNLLETQFRNYFEK